MTKTKSSKSAPLPPPPPIPPPLTANLGEESSQAEDISDNVSVPNYSLQSTSTVPKDLRKFLNQPPPAFHQYPQLVSQPQLQSQPATSKVSPYATYPGIPPNYYINSYSSSVPSNNNFSANWNSNFSRRNNFTYDPAAHGIISRLAEERTRPTFSSIETILDAFSSINMILDSTYSAIHGSFRTITGVADHLIFVRNHLAEIALFPRVVQIVVQFCRWLLKMFGLDQTALMNRLNQRNQEHIWNEALASGVSTNEELKQLLLKQQSGESGSSSPLWPIFVFFSLVLGTPYIIWRLLGAPGSIPRTNCPEWTLPRGRHFAAVALHSFKARNSNELSFDKDRILFIKPESLHPGSKWLIACLAGTPTGTNQIGLIPLNYVKLVMK